MFNDVKIRISLGITIFLVLVLFAASKIMAQPRIGITSQTIISSDNTQFVVAIDPATQCGTPVICRRPNDKDETCRVIPLNDLVFISKKDKKIPVVDFSTPGTACSVVILRDDSENSTYYCVAKRCYY